MGSIEIIKLTQEELIAKIKSLAQEERRVTLELLQHLKEMDTRKLYLDLGFSSLFEYLTKELSYSESSAYRRIQSMRMIKEIPELEGKVASGAVNLSTLTQVSRFFKRQAESSSGQTQIETEEQSSSRIWSSDEKLSLIGALENKSSRTVERELAALSPENPAAERFRAISSKQTELKIILNREQLNKFNRLKSLMSHKNLSSAELIEAALDVVLEKVDPARKEERARNRLKKLKTASASLKPRVEDGVSLVPTNNKKIKEKSRYIAQAVRRKVWIKGDGRCSYVDPATKRKCESQHFIQIDHIQPFHQDGDNSEKNLRLLCGEHNRRRYDLEN